MANTCHCKKFLIENPEVAVIIAEELRKLWGEGEYPLGENLWLIKIKYILSSYLYLSRFSIVSGETKFIPE